ncbi:MAG: hypothetical protein A2252_11660 [Elusimicrobia bacterium RIFOXYA2_FULL_39_19]|nr:MAG: hypothetical protein A2252_11660 [Elusimicrobia bacterium RIFOXYA2_FULL_39_19]
MQDYVLQNDVCKVVVAEDGSISGWDIKNDRALFDRCFSQVFYKDESGCISSLKTNSNLKKDIRIENNNAIISVKNNDSVEYEVTIELPENESHFFISSKIRNNSGKSIRLDRIDLFSFLSSENGKFYISKKDIWWNFLEVPFTSYPVKAVNIEEDIIHSNKRYFRSYIFTIIQDAFSDNCLTAGFVTVKDFIGEIYVNTHKSVDFAEEFRASNIGDGIYIENGAECKSERLYLNFIDKNKQGISCYSDILAAENKPLIKEKTVSAWSPFVYFAGKEYREKTTEKNILAMVKHMSENKAEYPFEYIQIDSGYQIFKGDWDKWNEKFPHGPKWFADQVKKYGFKPGIWMTPFLVSKQSDMAKEHPDWLMKNEKDEPREINHFGEVGYILDCSHPGALNWMEELGRKWTKEYGYEYIKFDGAVVGAFMDGILYDKKVSKAKAYRMGIEAFRKGIGDDTYFIGGAFSPSIGVVNAMRVGEDIGAKWGWKKSGRKGGYTGPCPIIEGIPSTLNMFFLNRKVWHNDPDYIVVRQEGDNSDLSENEAIFWASLLSMSGGNSIWSDNPLTLAPKRKKILDKVLIPHTSTAEPLNFMKERIPYVYNLSLKLGHASYNVVGLFNHSEDKKTFKLDFKELGVNAESNHVFDFWKEKYMGIHKNEIEIRNVPARSVVLLRVTPVADVPQVVGTDIHITQGAVELSAAAYNEQLKEYELKVKKFAGKTGKIYIALPGNFKPKGLKAKKGIVELKLNLKKENKIKIKAG